IDIEAYAQKGMRDWQIPGMAIAIVQGDEVIFSKGFGIKDINSKAPVTEDTIFQIGSTSKAFTTTLMAMLQDAGKFKWEEPVVNYLPDFMLYDPWVTREFQVWDLMAQHSGLPGYSADSVIMCGFDRAYVRSILRYIKPVSSFRAKYAYQNHLFLVAAELLEKLSGKTWEDNVRERIFAPLGMTNSSVDMDSFQRSGNAASLHVKSGDKVIVLPMDWKYMDWVYKYGPAGGINSNIKDMAKWIKFQINSGAVSGKQLVSQENMQFLRSPKTITEADFEGHKAYYCQGWLYMENQPYPIIWHNGGTTGMKTMVAFIPEAKIGIVILSNLITSFPELLAFRFFDEYFGKSVKDTSAEALAKEKKEIEEAKAKLPKKPEYPSGAMPLEKYSGTYSNPVYGKIKVEVKGDTLIVTGGPRPMQLVLKHWDKDIFSESCPDFGFEDSGGVFARFEVGPDNKITGLTIDSLNQIRLTRMVAEFL
ncbi:MAG: serine hydrolase, partial [Candidatus Omnitrophica bacterium]|nr:serine hydrolase [Candidatus Omnitrophota bacterium]